MSVLFILARAELNTGTVCALATAFEIRTVETVSIIVRDSGNLDDILLNWFPSVIICNPSNFPFELKFEQRISEARKIIAKLPSDIVWIDSFSASDFACAAKLEGRQVVLQSYDAISDIPRLLQKDLTKRDSGVWLDGLILPQHEWLNVIRVEMENLPERIVLRPPRIIASLEILAENSREDWRKIFGNYGYIELISRLRKEQGWIV